MTDAGRGLALLMLCALAACGEGSDNEDGDEDAASDGIEGRLDGLIIEVEGVSYTEPASLPTTGAANYDGMAVLNFAAIRARTLGHYDMKGDHETTVDIGGAGGRVVGAADGSVAIDGIRVVYGGSIDPGPHVDSGYTFGADLTGELTGKDGTSWIVDTGLKGK